MSNLFSNPDFSSGQGPGGLIFPADDGTTIATDWLSICTDAGSYNYTTPGFLAVKNTNGVPYFGIYQVVASDNTYASTQIKITVTGYSSSSTLRIIADDGVSPQQQDFAFTHSTPNDDVAVFVVTLDPSATQLVIYLINNSANQVILRLSLAELEVSMASLFKNVNDSVALIDSLTDVFNQFIRVSLSDGILLTDSLFSRLLSKVFSDTVLIQDWLRIRRIRINRWFN